MATSKSNSNRRPYRYDLDNLRTFGSALVVAQHTIMAYAGFAGQPPHSALFDKSSPIFTPYVLLNEAWGLGLFFYLSGHMSAQSLTKSTGWEFVKSKILRLGVPTLLYSAFLHPLEEVILRPRGGLLFNLTAYFKKVRDFRLANLAEGAVWYTATLLIFDLCAVLLKRCFYLFSNGRARTSEFSKLAKTYALLCRWGWLGVAGGSFLVGKKFPPGKSLPIINVQPFNLPQYIYTYALGHMAFNLGTHGMKGFVGNKSQPMLSLGKALAISLGTLPLVLLPRLLRTKNREKDSDTKEVEEGLGLGGWNSTTALYAIWHELTFITVAPAMLTLFERNYNQPGTSKIWSPRYAFAAYILHTPLSWVALRGVDAVFCPQGKRPAWIASKTWADFGQVAVIGAASMMDTVASFGVGGILINYVPGVDTIL